MEVFLEALAIILFSGVKLLFTPIGAVINPVSSFNLIEIALLSSAGGVLGSIIFFFISKGIDSIGDKKYKSAEKGKKKKVFSKKNRMIVNIKNNFGLFGMSMTIGIISVPIGAFLVGKYFNKEKAAIPSLIAASFIWGFGVTFITALFTDVLIPYFSA